VGGGLSIGLMKLLPATFEMEGNVIRGLRIVESHVVSSATPMASVASVSATSTKTSATPLVAAAKLNLSLTNAAASLSGANTINTESSWILTGDKIILETIKTTFGMNPKVTYLDLGKTITDLQNNVTVQENKLKSK